MPTRPAFKRIFLVAGGLSLVVASSVLARGACPGAGDCFVPNGSPGCNDEACCNAVCAVDPFCCTTDWDNLCVDGANQLCGGGGSCSPACGKVNVECLVGSPEYASRMPVAQLVAGGSAFCTAWIVAAPDIIMTNQHCVAGGIGGVSARFNVECDACTNGATKPTSSFAVTQIIHQNAALDFALLRVSGNPAATWGVASVDDSQPTIGQAIYEIHHGEGRVKGYDTGQITSLNVPGVCLGGTAAEVGISAIATGGASGSPVFSAVNHCVVAICHCGPPCQAGWGVPMSFIWPDALPKILAAGGTPGTCGVAPPACPEDCATPSDGNIDVTDLLAMLGQWGGAGGCDLDGSGTVDVTDLLLMLGAWGACP